MQHSNCLFIISNKSISIAIYAIKAIDGLTTTTNESLDEIQESILVRTGSNYPQEIRSENKSIRTGEARLAPGHPNLPCRHLVFTVTPRFSEKYRTAAETALYSCYS